MRKQKKIFFIINMPQLDKFAFAPQVFWLILVFILIYLLVLKSGLSVLYRILSFRKKTINLFSTQVSVFSVETTLLNLVVSKFIAGFLLNRQIGDQIFKLTELFSIREVAQNSILISVRNDLVNKPVSLVFVGTKQGLLPVFSKNNIVI